VIFLVGCSNPIPEQTVQDPNVTPEGVRITPDIVYGHKFGMALTFDMYQPKYPNGAGVIILDSGSYRSFFPNYYVETKNGLRLAIDEIGGNNLESFLSKGMTVFVVRHGSSPKFKMREIVSDLRRAIRFIKFNANEYSVDSERIGLFGASSGGHLSLLLATTGDIGNPNSTEEFEKSSGRVAAVAVHNPPTELKRFIGFILDTNPDILKRVTALALEPKEFKEFSPVYYISSDDPPTLIIHGDKDQVVPIIEGESMYKELLKAGVKSDFVKIPGAGHGSEGEDNDRVLTETVRWFEKYLAEK
jgi:predicted esterase